MSVCVVCVFECGVRAVGLWVCACVWVRGCVRLCVRPSCVSLSTVCGVMSGCMLRLCVVRLCLFLNGLHLIECVCMSRSVVCLFFCLAGVLWLYV